MRPEKEPEVRLLSDRGDIVPINFDTSCVVLFEGEEMPACVEILKDQGDSMITERFFINNGETIDNLLDIGIDYVSVQKPHLSHIDSYTDANNNSSEVEWLLDAEEPDSESYIFEVDDEFEDEIPEPQVYSPLIPVEIGGEKIELNYGNTEVTFIESDAGLSNMQIMMPDGDSKILFACDIAEELTEGLEILKSFYEESFPTTFLPLPDRQTRTFYRQRAFQRFDDEAEELLSES